MEIVVETLQCTAILAMFFTWLLIPETCSLHTKEIEAARDEGESRGIAIGYSAGLDKGLSLAVHKPTAERES